MIVQTPESFFQKRHDAQERVDKYLLILATFKNGLAFGSKFNERQSKPGQWLLTINANVIVGSIGDFADFQEVISIISGFCQNTDNLIGIHYATGSGIEKNLSQKLQDSFEKKGAVWAVNFIVADCREKTPSLWFIDFDGRVKPLKNFAVAGGSEYKKPLNKDELERLTPEEKNIFAFQKENLKKAGLPVDDLPLIPSLLRQPRKEAIAYLEKNWKPKMKKEEAVGLVKKTLFEYNPESHDKTIEITVIEYGKDPKFLYFKKGNKKIKIK